MIQQAAKTYLNTGNYQSDTASRKEIDKWLKQRIQFPKASTP